MGRNRAWHLALLATLSAMPATGQIANAEASLGAREFSDDDYSVSVTPDVFTNKEDNSVETKSLVFIRDLKNITKEVGDSVKVKCEVQGDPAAIRFKWFKNE